MLDRCRFCADTGRVSDDIPCDCDAVETSEELPPVSPCPACDSWAEHLGTLGCLAWFRCHACGLDHSVTPGAL